MIKQQLFGPMVPNYLRSSIWDFEKRAFSSWLIFQLLTGCWVDNKMDSKQSLEGSFPCSLSQKRMVIFQLIFGGILIENWTKNHLWKVDKMLQKSRWFFSVFCQQTKQKRRSAARAPLKCCNCMVMMEHNYYCWRKFRWYCTSPLFMTKTAKPLCSFNHSDRGQPRNFGDISSYLTYF